MLLLPAGLHDLLQAGWRLAEVLRCFLGLIKFDLPLLRNSGSPRNGGFWQVHARKTKIPIDASSSGLECR